MRFRDLPDGRAVLRRERGLLTHIAKQLGMTRGAIACWQRVPAEMLPQVEVIAGIPRWELRPDICLPPGVKGPTLTPWHPPPKPPPKKRAPRPRQPPTEGDVSG